MKSIPQALQSHLDGGATTLCWCWRLVRRDAVSFGFTDHDRSLSFDGTVFEASAGFTATEAKETVGLSVDNLEVEGAVTSERLSEGDLAAGLYDGADVEIYRVNWQSPDQRVLMRKGSIGEVRRGGEAFVAEIRGLAHALNQPQGRLFQFQCDAELGDERCGIDLDQSTFKSQATVVTVHSAHEFDVTGLEGFATAWFDRGLLAFVTGPNAGRTFRVKSHDSQQTAARVVLWQSPPDPISPGDTVAITAGCDKRIGTCRDKFQNVENFRGFPHMPGTRFVTTVHGGESP